MTLKSRLLRILLIVLLIVGVGGYFTFSTLFFSPTESDLDADVAALVPRDVDFFVAKADLAGLFDEFPNLAVMKRVEAHPAWKAFQASPQYGELATSLQLEAITAQIRSSLAQLPISIEPLKLFGGRDLAAAGYFRGADLNLADWAVYGRANWMGKLAASALEHPGLIGLAKQGITATVDPQFVKLSGGQLTRTLYVTRLRDVVIVATQPELARAAHELTAKGYQDSFLQSAAYFDHIQSANRDAQRDELEIYLNSRKLFENLRFTSAWPNPASQDFLPAFLGRFFQLHSIKNAIGVVGIDEGVSIDLHGDFSSEQISAEQERLYRVRGFDQNTILADTARLAPADTSLFVFLHAGVGDLLTMIVAAFEPALRTNLEDAIRNTGKYQSLAQFVKELDGALKGRVALIVRPNDYPPDPDGPPHDGTPVPAVALVLWTKNVETINALRETIGSQGAKFGLQGRKPGEPGYFRNSEAGHDTREFWSQFIPGTGIVATGNSGELTIVTNSLGMLGHILKTYTQGGTKYPRLAEDSRFEALVTTSLPRANVLVWANPQTAAKIVESGLQRYAQDTVFDQVDWKMERVRIQGQVLREQFPGKGEAALSPDEKQKLESTVDQRIDAMEAKIRAEQVPAIIAEQQRILTYCKAVQAALCLLVLDPKSFELSIRATVPLAAE
ncbi:MAG: hypothetical protein ACKVWV_01395 [Planctomycetota bacterium]